ncbi:hypothetical protein C4D60_Mb01t29050 [Musa balbisiana]|uniref:Uncharacterized protein n=1 Tax=Musa balbisiana TaxID=52838 RepID=A0A4V4H7P5_MUSBA|nr:hypothetical protein C4D60_Mb01t29050 [Musa balbisiana]
MSSQEHVHCSWAVALTVAAVGIRGSKGTHATVVRLETRVVRLVAYVCSVSVTEDAKQGGATVGRRTTIVAWWLAAMVGWLGGDGARGEEEC